VASFQTFEYYSARVLAAQAMAQQAGLAKVRGIHLEMADRYRVLAADTARALCGQQLSSGDLAQPPVQVVLVEPGNLHKLYRV